VIPLAAVIGAATAAGVGAERRYRESADRLARGLMSLTLWALLPIVAFFNIAALDLRAEVGAGIGFGYAAQAATLAAAFLVGTYALRLRRPSVGALMGAAAFGNTGYLGLPFTAAAFGFDELPDAVAYDVVVSGVGMVTIGFSVGAAFGTVAERPGERIAAFVVRNPPLWASAAGLVAPGALAPDWAVDASQALVLAILPLGFFAVGVTLAAEAEQGGGLLRPPLAAPVASAVVLKVLLAPAVVAGLSGAFIEVPDSYLTQAAMASAITNILVANEYGLDRRLAAAAIAWSTAVVVLAGLVAGIV